MLGQQLLVNHKQANPSNSRKSREKKKKNPKEVKPQKVSEFNSENLWKLNKRFNKVKFAYLKKFKKGEERKTALITARAEAKRALTEEKGGIASNRLSLTEHLKKCDESQLDLLNEDFRKILKGVPFDNSFSNVIDACDLIAGLWIQRKEILTKKDEEASKTGENPVALATPSPTEGSAKK